MSLDINLAEQNILVTGASGCIGIGITRVLVTAGAHVAAHYNSGLGELEGLLKTPQVAGHVFPVQGDLSTADGAGALFADATAAVGDLSGIVNNAGIQPVVEFTTTTPDEIDEMLGVNARAPFILIQHLARAGGGAVVNIGSIEGLQPASMHAHYAVSKAAITMLSRAAALECGEKVRVNTIAPGLIDREGLAEAWPEGVARWQKAAPLRRLGRPEDVGNAVAFLLSDRAAWITGATLTVDGGVNACNTW